MFHHMFNLSQREWVLFAAGAEAFHTLSHISIYFAGILPMKFLFVDWTPQLNTAGIIINGLITLGLLWWASELD